MAVAAKQSEAMPSGRQRLLEAAAAGFAEGGYSGTSIATIARTAGMSKSTVFHHFPSKEALYLAVIGDAVADFGQRLDHALSASDDIATTLRIFQREHIRHMDRHRQVVRLILRELQDPALEHKRPLIIELLSTNFTRLVDRLEAARRDGRIRPTANCPVAALVLFATNAFFFQHAGELGALPGLEVSGRSDDFAEAVVDVLHNGLAPDDSTGATT